MTSMWILTIGFFLANFIWFIAVLNTTYLDYVNPKYLASSFDKDQNEELESILLKSLERYIGKYFNEKKSYDSIESEYHLNLNKANIVQNMNLKIKENFSSNSENNTLISEKLRNYEQIKITNLSKISMFLDKDKKIIYIVKVSNERMSPHKFEGKVGEVELFYIPVVNFLSATEKNENLNIENSLIKKCWSSTFNGRIFGAVSSNDKSSLSIFYRIVKGPTVNYRIRFFHNISCDNFEIEKTDDILADKYSNYLNMARNKTSLEENDPLELEPYYEISEREVNSQNNNKNNEDKFHSFNLKFPNYFNDKSYDDFSLKGNIPISAMAIKNNVLAYSRDMDYRQFYVLKRERTLIPGSNTEYTRKWIFSFIGPKNDKNQFNFFHSRSLKFANDDVHDYKLLNVILTANSTGIITYGFLYKANHSESVEDKINNVFNTSDSKYLFTPLLGYSHNKEVLFNNKESFENFNLDDSMNKLKKLMKPTVFSNTNHDSLLFELNRGYITQLTWNKDDTSDYINNYTPEGFDKISKISADENTMNIILKFENSNEMMYLSKYRESDSNISFDVYKNINFKSLPKKYRNKEIVSYFLQHVDDKLILFMLNQDGIIISLDFTKISKKRHGGNWLYNLLFSDFNYTASYVIFINLIMLIVYLKYFRRHIVQADPLRNRNNEINQVIQDILRLNNLQMAIGGNLHNLAQSNNNNNQISNRIIQEPINQINEQRENNNENDIQIANEDLNQINENTNIINSHNNQNGIVFDNDSNRHSIQSSLENQFSSNENENIDINSLS